MTTPDENRLPPLSRAESAALGRRRRVRNIFLLLLLVGVAVLFYAIAMVKLTPGRLSGG